MHKADVALEINDSERHSLAHVQGEVDVLLLGEEQDEEVVTCLTLLDGRIQADLLVNRGTNWINSTIR